VCFEINRGWPQTRRQSRCFIWKPMRFWSIDWAPCTSFIFLISLFGARRSKRLSKIQPPPPQKKILMNNFKKFPLFYLFFLERIQNLLFGRSGNRRLIIILLLLIYIQEHRYYNGVMIIKIPFLLYYERSVQTVETFRLLCAWSALQECHRQENKGSGPLKWKSVTLNWWSFLISGTFAAGRRIGWR
jgi:hypothetical protein